MLYTPTEGQMIIATNSNDDLVQSYVQTSAYSAGLVEAFVSVIGADVFVINSYLSLWRDLHYAVGIKGLALEQERSDFYMDNEEVIDIWLNCTSQSKALDLIGEIIGYLPAKITKRLNRHNLATVWLSKDLSNPVFNNIAAAVVDLALYECGRDFTTSYETANDTPAYQAYLENLNEDFNKHSNKALVLNYLTHNHDARSNMAQTLVNAIGVDGFVANARYFANEYNEWVDDGFDGLDSREARLEFYLTNKDIIYVWLKAESAIRGVTELNFMEYPVPCAPIRVIGHRENRIAVLLDGDKEHVHYDTIVDSFMVVMMGVVGKDFLEFSCDGMGTESSNKAAFEKGYAQAKADIIAYMRKSNA